MSLPNLLMNTVKALFPETIKRELRCSLPIPDTEACLARMQRNGFQPKLVVDVGAYVGDWTRMCRRIFPDASILMIEPQAATQSALQQIAAQGESIELARALLGKVHNSQIPFYEAQSGSSVLTEWEREGQQPTTTIDMTTLDAVTADTAFAMPDLLKLDVQGYELEILKGAERVLASAEAVLLEVNFIDIHSGAPLFHEVVQFMAEHEFRLYDIGTFFRRPYDAALWQADAVFVKFASPLVSSKRWN
jgi:FkbM family methyltransferase